MKNRIQLYAEIDLLKEPNETRVKPIEGDPWNDLGYWLEVTGFMAYQAMKYTEKTPEEIAQYCKEYIGECVMDYKIKKYET